MTKTILLKLDQEFFFELSKGKHDLESEIEKTIKWEQFIKIIFTKSKLNRRTKK